jgi:hypothetical protein
MSPFYSRTDKEGQQLFNEDDDDGVGFVAERAIDDERVVGADMKIADDIEDELYHHVHVPIFLDEINKMNMVQLKNILKSRQQSLSGAKLKLKERLIKALVR